MYQAGTLSGNPLAMVAGLVTLQQLSAEGAFAQIEQQATKLADGLKATADGMGIPVQVAHVGSMFGCYFLNDEAANQPANPITDYTTVRQYAHPQRYAKFFWNLIDRGVYFAPSQFEAGFMSLVHSDDDIDHTLNAVRESLAQV
jgi:glutamate-1-semialdehyde 2,1-aminomutase